MKVHSYHQEFLALSSLGMNMCLISKPNRNNRRYVYDFTTGAGVFYEMQDIVVVLGAEFISATLSPAPSRSQCWDLAVSAV